MHYYGALQVVLPGGSCDTNCLDHSVSVMKSAKIKQQVFMLTHGVLVAHENSKLIVVVKRFTAIS